MFDYIEIEVSLMGIGSRVRAYMEEIGRTAEWLSRETGIRRDRLERILLERGRMGYWDYARICGALGLPPEYFFESGERAEDGGRIA